VAETRVRDLDGRLRQVRATRADRGRRPSPAPEAHPRAPRAPEPRSAPADPWLRRRRRGGIGWTP